MKDPVFGKLSFDGDVYTGVVRIDYFRGFGTELDRDRTDTPADAAIKRKMGSNVGPRPITAEQRKFMKKYKALLDKYERKPEQSGGMLPSLRKNYAKMLTGDFSILGGGGDDDDGSPVEPSEEERLFRQGRFFLTVERAPKEAQRTAWKAALKRGTALWDEVMDHATAEYQAQLPVRREWWKRAYGDYRLNRALPEVKSRAAMGKRVRPFGVRVGRTDPRSGQADVLVIFNCTYLADGFGVVIRAGAVAEVIPYPFEGAYAYYRTPLKARLDDAAFGPLRRTGDAEPWVGLVPIGPWKDFATVAEERSQFQADPHAAGVPRSQLRWDFCRGEVEIAVQSRKGQPPSEKQAEAYDRWRASEKRNADAVLHAVFRQYQKLVAARRRAWRVGNVDDLVPKANSVAGLRENLQLLRINVFPEEKGRAVRLGFQFTATWGLDTVLVAGVVWRDGRVEKVGSWDDAEVAGAP